MSRLAEDAAKRELEAIIELEQSAVEFKGADGGG
jgi:hypothetical protein